MGAPHVLGKDQRKPDHFGGSGSCKNASRDIYFVSPNLGGSVGRSRSVAGIMILPILGGCQVKNGNGCFPLTYHADNFDNGKIEGWLYTGEP